MAQYWSPADIKLERSEQYEAANLMIDSSKAAQHLGWRPAYSLDDSMALTAQWYKTYQLNPDDLTALTETQLIRYFEKI